MMDAEEPKTKRRSCQYSLRSLFVLTTLLAILGSWYAYEMQQAAKRRAAIAEIEKLGGQVLYFNLSKADVRPGVMLQEEPSWHSVLRSIHGDVYLGRAVYVKFEGVPVSLFFEGTSFGDDELTHLEYLKDLEYLSIAQCGVTDAGLKRLEGLSRLEYVHLFATKVTEEGVKDLQRALPNCVVRDIQFSGDSPSPGGTATPPSAEAR